MAKIINVVLKRQAVTGVICSSTRQIVVWGPAAEGDTVDMLTASLIDAEQLLTDQTFTKTHSDIVRDVCNELFPNSWFFVAQGRTVEFYKYRSPLLSIESESFTRLLLLPPPLPISLLRCPTPRCWPGC